MQRESLNDIFTIYRFFQKSINRTIKHNKIIQKLIPNFLNKFNPSYCDFENQKIDTEEVINNFAKQKF